MISLRTGWLLAAALLCLTLLVGLAARARAGELMRIEFSSTALDRPWRYNVYLPDGYEDGRLRYPVLYLLHGHKETADEWVVKGGIQALMDQLIAEKRVPPAIVVMPDADDSWYVDGPEKMQTAFIRDLIPDVEQRFRAMTRREGRVIGGESMGGYGALRFVLQFPELFQAAALLSPAVYVPLPPENSSARSSPPFQRDGKFDPELWTARNYPTLLPGFLEQNVAVPLYLGCGSKDQFAIDFHMAKLYLLWLRNRWSVRWRIALGGHDFDLWRKLAPPALTFVFRTVAKPEPVATPINAQIAVRPPG